MPLTDQTLHALVDEAVATRAPLDKLINQAMYGDDKAPSQMTAEEWKVWLRGIAIWDQKKAPLLKQLGIGRGISGNGSGNSARTVWAKEQIGTTVEQAWKAIEESSLELPRNERWNWQDLADRLKLHNRRHAQYVVEKMLGFKFTGVKQTKRLVAGPCKQCKKSFPRSDLGPTTRMCTSCQRSQ